MKIPEIVVKEHELGYLYLASDKYLVVECPWHPTPSVCGSWCPHFEVASAWHYDSMDDVTGHSGANVTLWCTAQPRPFGTLRVVEPENKEETK